MIQLEIIYDKVNEYFKKNPKTKSAIFEISFGKNKGKFRVVKEGDKLRIQEGPAAKILQNKQQAFANMIAQEKAALEQERSALQQQVADIQQAQQPTSQLSVPSQGILPSPVPSGPPMNALSSTPVPPMSMPPMPIVPAPMPAAPMPAAPMPAAPMPAVTPPPIPISAAPPPISVSPGEGLPPPPEPMAKSPEEPSGDPGSVPLPPGARDGDINASQAADVVRDLFANEPDAMQRQFGSVNVGNPNIPPDLAVGTEPPREEEGVVQDAAITPGVVRIGDVERAFDDTMNRMPFSPENAPQQAQKALNMAMQVATDPQNPEDAEDALNMARGLQTVAGLSSVNAGKVKSGKVLREQNPEIAMVQKSVSDEVPFMPSTAEESALLRGLKGKTIQDVSVENDEDSVRISLSLATTSWPVVFEFERGGKVTYTFKDRRYVLLKRWH